ncbi:MAG: phage portal protein [Neomegalonema sp.]|nr:phage portal protein [Neomegalonema sp.]
MLNWFRRPSAQAPATSERAMAVRAASNGAVSTDGMSSKDVAEMIRGGGGAGGAVTVEKALRVAVAWRCVNLISGTVATMPLGVMLRDGEDRQPASHHPVHKLLARRPNGWQTPSGFRRQLQAHLLLSGNAYCRIVRGYGGKITDLVPISPGNVTVVQRTDMTLAYQITSPAGRRETVSPQQIWHLRGLSLDGVTGISVLHFAAETFGAALASDVAARRAQENGGMPSVSVEVPETFNEVQVQNVVASVRGFVQEPKAGGVLPTFAGAKVNQISMTAADMEFLARTKLTQEQVCMFFGVPPILVGASDKIGFGNAPEHLSSAWVAYGLNDWLVSWEESINRDLIGDDVEHFGRFNRAALVRGDLKARTDALSKMCQFGGISPNEWRAIEDMPPREGGDIFYPPPNMNAVPDNKGAQTEESAA